jgi:hypothetical protein
VSLQHLRQLKYKGKAKTSSLFGKSSTKFSFSFYFSQKYQIKNILTFLHFLNHINNFLLLFNQKNPLQNKIFSLFYKTFSNFLSHQSFLTTIQINIPIHNHLSNKPFILATSLCKYCAYLVAFAPRLLPDHAYTAKTIFDQVVGDARDPLRGFKTLTTRYGKMMTIRRGRSWGNHYEKKRCSCKASDSGNR